MDAVNARDAVVGQDYQTSKGRRVTILSARGDGKVWVKNQLGAETELPLTYPLFPAPAPPPPKRVTVADLVGGPREVIAHRLIDLTDDELLDLGSKDSRSWLAFSIQQEIERRTQLPSPVAVQAAAVPSLAAPPLLTAENLAATPPPSPAARYVHAADGPDVLRVVDATTVKVTPAQYGSFRSMSPDDGIILDDPRADEVTALTEKTSGAGLIGLEDPGSSEARCRDAEDGLSAMRTAATPIPEQPIAKDPALPPPPTPRATCPRCGKSITLNQDGRLRSHTMATALSCPGNGRTPEQASTDALPVVTTIETTTSAPSESTADPDLAAGTAVATATDEAVLGWLREARNGIDASSLSIERVMGLVDDALEARDTEAMRLLLRPILDLGERNLTVSPAEWDRASSLLSEAMGLCSGPAGRHTLPYDGAQDDESDAFLRSRFIVVLDDRYVARARAILRATGLSLADLTDVRLRDLDALRDWVDATEAQNERTTRAACIRRHCLALAEVAEQLVTAETAIEALRKLGVTVSLRAMGGD